jgi:hypothetical protein
VSSAAETLSATSRDKPLWRYSNEPWSWLTGCCGAHHGSRSSLRRLPLLHLCGHFPFHSPHPPPHRSTAIPRCEMAGGSGEAAMSPPSSGGSGGGKRGRDPEEDVYVDNLHSHKRYLSEVGRLADALLLPPAPVASVLVLGSIPAVLELGAKKARGFRVVCWPIPSSDRAGSQSLCVALPGFRGLIPRILMVPGAGLVGSRHVPCRA